MRSSYLLHPTPTHLRADFVDPQERIKELSYLIAALPIANYSLLRALTAHLILIVQNAHLNKMTMRNVGIVFSPTLGIPAGVFSLMLGEFNRVFNVDTSGEGEDAKSADGVVVEDPIRRNSRQYTDAAADQLLGLSGRTLTSKLLPPQRAPLCANLLSAPLDEGQSDAESVSLDYDDSGAESTEDSSRLSEAPVPEPSTPKATKAAQSAADRGLNIAVSKRGNRHSRIIGGGGGGLPPSPHPIGSPNGPPPVPHPPSPAVHR